MKRIRRAAEEICRRQPDIVCFQEVWRKSYAAEITALCERAGYARVPAGSGGRSSGGLVTLFRATHWTVLHAHFSRFGSHAPAWRFWEGDGLSHKGILRTDLKRNTASEVVVVFNTHLQSQYGPGRGYHKVREAQIAELRSVADLAMPSQAPIIAAGDLNTEPGEPLYESIRSTWVDLTTAYRDSCQAVARRRCGTYLERRGVDGWIDYVLARAGQNFLYSAGIELIENRRRDVPFSDHHGLQADVSIRRHWLGAALEAIADPTRITRRRAVRMAAPFLFPFSARV